MLLCAFWWGWNPVGKSSFGGERLCQVSPILWCVRLCGCFQQAVYFKRGNVRTDYVFLVFQLV